MITTQTAFVTGGASGIGLAVVRRLLEDGFAVMAADRDATGLAAIGSHDRLTTTVLDVRDRAATRAALDA